MPLSVYTIEQDQEWDAVVRSFQSYDVYYLSGYVKAFQIHGDGEPLLFYYDDGVIRAINVVMKRDIADDSKFEGKIPLDTYFDIATSYGYGGPLIEGNKEEKEIKKIFNVYNTYCKENNIISEFVRFRPLLQNHKGLEQEYEIVNLGKTIHMDLDSEENIWKNLTSKNRNMIRKSEKLGVEINCGFNRELMDKFIELYNDTMKRANAREYYYFKNDFYKSIMKDLKDNLLFFYSLYEEKIISISMILLSNNKMHYHLSASDSKYLNLAPTNLLLYKAACWGLNKGYKIFHLGGGLESKKDSLYKFKKAFNRGADNDSFIGKKIFNQERYDELIEIREREKDFNKDTSFFPVYRI